ncbi:ABC transporter substrate-binding protein [Geothrix sp.]|jgi:peptide/nickel transport system substrate-binding protein|uniref:ABC transporter substrate-binding protein n=1 Tax=Geothrix sp. TaxID=1962974 RepID=UPI0025C4524F|nr:ABC transporter substrate-binding protein [Geothrix sp.]
MYWRRLILLTCLLCGLGAAEPIRVAVDEWTTVNPLLMSRDTDGEAVDLLFDRLVTLDADGNFIPELLQSWTILKGGREVVLELRPGMTWHDGTPIEAEDLVFTWRTLRLPQVRAIADTVGGVASLDSLMAEGPLRVRIRLSRPRGTLLSDLYNFIPVPRRHYQMGAKPMAAPVNFQPVGSGPYRVVERATTKHLKLERWEGYRGAHPGSWPAFEFSDPTAEKSTAKAILEGRFHFAATSALSHYLVRKGALGAGHLQVYSVPQAAFGAFFLNCDPKRSLLGELALREALAELTPWQEFARARQFFPARLASSFWPPENWAHDPEPRPLPQAERAESILESAGWHLGSGGVRRDAKGRTLSLVAYEQVNSATRSMARLLAERAAKVGIRIEVRKLTFQALTEKSAEHEGDIWSYGWTTSLDPDVDAPLFTRDGYRTKANVSGYLNPEVDRLFDEGRHTLDPEARRKIYLKLSEIIWRDKPVIPLNYNLARILATRRLQGVSFNVLGQAYGFWPGKRGWTLVD